MSDTKQATTDPKIEIEDLEEKKPDEKTEDVTGGGANLQQSFNPQSIGGALKEDEKVGLVWK